MFPRFEVTIYHVVRSFESFAGLPLPLTHSGIFDIFMKTKIAHQTKQILTICKC